MQLFTGRTDVYAKRFVNKRTGKAGYAPVCGNSISRAFGRCCHIHGTRGKKIFDRQPLFEQGASESDELVNELTSSGVNVVTKNHIHQKFAVIDRRVVWYGSINLLSYGRSEESMMRFENREIAEELLTDMEKLHIYDIIWLMQGGDAEMKYRNNYSHVIWDWNGTLFDDVEWCICVMNQMLEKRGMRKIAGISEYHEAFVFPIINYYRNVGFDFAVEPFEALAAEYIDLYHSENSGNCKLRSNAETVLNELQENQIVQVILSASESNNLASQMKQFPIGHYFDEVLGLTDVYAASKVEVGREYIKKARAEKIVLIGDSVHDYDVAKALDIDCILIANGHQAKAKLSACSVPVLDDVFDAVRLIV